MDHKIIDRVMNEFWNGKGVDINSGVLDYSTGYNLLVDKNQLMISDKIVHEIGHTAFNFESLREKTHNYKFFVWKESI